MLRQPDVDPKQFALSLKQPEGQLKGVPEGTKRWHGDMKWIEPFVTRKSQTLHLEVHIWKANDRQLVFVCASPKEKTTDIWKQMHKIRSEYQKKGNR